MIQKYTRLRDSGITVFDRRTIANILRIVYASTNPILNRLVEKGILLRLKRDKYVLAYNASDSSRKIANELVKPSYISLWTALNDVGISTQFPRMVQSVTYKRSQTIGEKDDLLTFEYQCLPERLYFGYELDTERIFRAKPEKALLDLLYVQKGSIDWDSIAIEDLDLDILCKMAKKFPPRVRNVIDKFLPRK